MAETIKIGGELESMATGKIVAAASAIRDYDLNKSQSELNAFIQETKQAVDELSPDQTEALALATDVVNLKDDVAQGAVFDVSEKYPTSGIEGGNTYTLEGALAVLNASLSARKRKGGMSIKFVQSSDNKYVQYRLMSDEFSTTPADWQGVDAYGKKESANLLESKAVANIGVINVTLEYPLNSGYYQITDASADNYAPSVIPVNRRVQGMILKIEVSQYKYELYKFNGLASEPGSWLLPTRWKQITDNSNLEEKLKYIGIINVTTEYPLSSGYYQITDSSAENFAPSVIPVIRRTKGVIIKIETSAYHYSAFIFDGYPENAESWSNPSRWVEIVRADTLSSQINNSLNTFLSYVSQSRLRFFKTDNSWNGSGGNMNITDADFDANIPYVLFVKFADNGRLKPLRTITIGGTARYVKYGFLESRNLYIYETADRNIYYMFMYLNGIYYLVNPSQNMLLSPKDNTDLADYLEIGGIDTGGQETENDQRLRTDVFIKSPVIVNIKNGYNLYLLYKYPADGGNGSYEMPSKNGPLSYKIDYDGFVRLMFKANPNRTFTTVESTGIVSPVDIPVPEDTDKETLSINTVEELVIIGQSHAMGHGSIKNKSFASYLSAFTDWNVANLATDGNNYILCLSQFLNNSSSNAGAKFNEINGGGICFDFLGGNAENYYFQGGMDGSYTIDNMKRLYSVLKSKGYEIIPATAFGDQSNSIDCIQAITAKELGLQLADINNTVSRINQKSFLPYWYDGHFGTRTNANQYWHLLQAANIRRPRTSIKIFRLRNAVTDNSELLYKSLFERLRLFEEISVNHKALPSDKNNYVDRLDKLRNDGYTDEVVNSEYTGFKNGTAISIADKGLVEIILPTIANGIKNLEVTIGVSGTPNIYVRKYIDNSLIIATTPAQANFKIASNISNIQVGDIFTDTLNSGVTFTVVSIDSETDYISCDASGDFVTPGQTTDTLTRQSDSQTFTATFLGKGVPSGYISASETGYGMWEAVTKDSNGKIVFTDLSKYMDYDKLTFLIDGATNISNVEATFDKPSVSKDYATKSQISALDLKNYSFTPVLESAFVSGDMEGTLVNTSGNSYFWDGIESVDGVNKPHIPSFYNAKGATSILHLKQGDKITYTISDLLRPTASSDYLTHVKLKLVARYFPASNLNVDAATFTITDKTFDFGKIGIKTVIGGNDSCVFTIEKYLPTSFVETYVDLYYDARSGNTLEVIAIDNNIELLYIEILK